MIFDAKDTEMRLCVTDIQRFCMHDGPGLRTTVFLKGCPLRCAWCHNPETQKSSAELLYDGKKCMGCRACEASCPHHVHSFSDGRALGRAHCTVCGACAANCPTGALERCGKDYTVGELLEQITRDRAFYGTNGGVTLSGGEPFLQGEATLALLRACREAGLSTAVESCGFAERDVICAAVSCTDLFLWDIKDTDDARHKRYTGVSLENIHGNLRALDSFGGATRLRCILVNGVNTDAQHYRSVAVLAASLRHCEGVEWLPYHAFGGNKATFLGRADSSRADWIPTEAQLEAARACVREHGIPVFGSGGEGA